MNVFLLILLRLSNFFLLHHAYWWTMFRVLFGVLHCPWVVIKNKTSSEFSWIFKQCALWGTLINWFLEKNCPQVGMYFCGVSSSTEDDSKVLMVQQLPFKLPEYLTFGPQELLSASTRTHQKVIRSKFLRKRPQILKSEWEKFRLSHTLKLMTKFLGTRLLLHLILLLNSVFLAIRKCL